MDFSRNFGFEGNKSGPGADFGLLSPRAAHVRPYWAGPRGRGRRGYAVWRRAYALETWEGGDGVRGDDGAGSVQGEPVPDGPRRPRRRFSSAGTVPATRAPPRALGRGGELGDAVGRGD